MMDPHTEKFLKELLTDEEFKLLKWIVESNGQLKEMK